MRTFTQKVAFALIALMCFAMPQVVMAQDCVDIGEGTTALNGNVPVASWYHNSYTQQLYTADEINHAAGNITSISFKYVSGATAMTRRISIYMANTDAANLSSAYVTSGFEEVLSSSVVTFDDSNEWITLDLTTPFAYDGTSNLVVAVWQDHDASVETGYASGSRFVQTSMTGMARYQQVDAGSYTLSDGVPTTGTGTTLSARANIQLCISGGSAGPTCDKPESVEANDVTANSATINWIGTAAAYNLQYKASTDADWTLVKNLSATSYALSNLASNTAYQVQVQAICGENTSGWKSVSFNTLIGLPYAEHFNASSAPSGWTIWSGQLQADGSATRTSSTVWSFGAGSNGVFDSHARANIYSTGCYRWLQLPAIPIPEMEEGDPGFQMYFSLALTKYSGTLVEVDKTLQQDDRFIVLVSIDGGANWTILREWNNSGSEYVYNDIAVAGEEVAPIDLSEYAGRTILLAFYGESTVAGGDNNIHVDDVIIEEIPTCLKPTGLHALDAQATSTTLPVAWTANSGEAAWRLQYKPTADAEADWITLDIATNPYTITGLDAFAEYEIRVAAVCTEEDFTDYGKSIIAKTAAVVPFLQTFDTTAMPGEWKRYEVLLEDVENSGAPLVASKTGWNVGVKNGVFNNEHLYLNIAGTDTKHWLVSPVIEMLDGYQLTFDLALTTATGSTPTAVTAGEQNDDMFIVFISTDGGENWTALGTWDNAGAGTSFDQISTEGQTVKFDLSAYAGESIMLAFYGESTVAGGDNNLHISNVAIDLIPACERPLSITLGTITGTTAEITWDADEDGTWEYGVKANPAADFAPAEADYTGTTDEKLAELSELDETTDYVFFVRRACSASEKSEPLMKAFKTIQTPAALPYDWNFESGNGWLFFNGELTNKWVYGTATSNSPTHALYISNDNGLSYAYTHAYTTVYATKTFFFPEAGLYSFSFEWKANSDAYDYLRVALAPAATEVEASSASTAPIGATSLPDGWIALDGGSKLCGQSNWQRQLSEVEVPQAGYHKVIIVWRNNTYTGDAPGAIDNFKISRLTCRMPQGLSVSDITATTASLSWNDDEDGMSWQYACVAAGQTPSEYEIVAQNSILVEGLEESSAYDFYLRKYCGEEDQSEAIMLSFQTKQLPAEVGNAYADNFENGNRWLLINGEMENAWVYGTAAHNGEGTHALYISNDGGTTNAYTNTKAATVFATKSLHFQNGAYTFQYDWKAKGESNYDLLRVALVPDSIELEASSAMLPGLSSTTGTALASELPAGWIALDGGSKLNLVDAWQTFTTDEINVEEGNYMVVLLWRDDTSGGTQTPAAVDNFSIARIVCATPADFAAIDTTATTTSIELTWTPMSEETNWVIRYKEQNAEDWAAVVPVATDTFKLLEGLNPATIYEAQIATQCDPEDAENIGAYSSSILFATECVPFATINEDFEGSPLCWSAIRDENGYPAILSNYPEDAYSGTKFLYFYSSASSEPVDEYVVLPELISLNNMRIKFMARNDYELSSSVEGAQVVVGVMPDQADTANFVALDTTELTSNVYSPIVVPFTAYTGDYKYVAIKMLAASQLQASLLIDDVVVEEIPACLEPTGLVVIPDSLKANSAVISWSAQGDEANWLVRYKKVADEEWNAPILVTDSTLSLENLEPATAYEAQVAAWCDLSNEDAKSPYTASLNFTTLYGIPFIEAFGTAIPADWNLYTGWLDSIAIGHAQLTAATSGWLFGTSNGVFDNHARSNIYGTTWNKWMVTPAIEMQAGVQLTFDLALTKYSGTMAEVVKGSQADDRFVVLYSVDNGANWSILREWNNAAGSEYVYDDIATAGQEIKIVLDDALAGMNVQFAFYGESSVSGGDNNIHVDNVKVAAIPSCERPMALVATATEANSVTLNWAPQDDEQAWVLQYKKSADSVWIALEEDVTVRPYTLTGLEPATVYDVMIAAKCSDEDMSEYTSAISFTTECLAITTYPYAEGFDSIAGATAAHVLPICWNYINTSTSGTYNYYPTVYAGASYANTPNNSLKFYSYYYSSSDPQDQYAILPEMEGLSGLRIKFNARKYSASYDATVYVGIMTDPADATTFVAIDTLAPASVNYEPFVVPFSSYASAGKYIAFKMPKATSSYRGLFIDDIVVEELPNCLEPTGLAISEITENGAKATWDNEENGAWKYAVALASAEQPALEAFASTNGNVQLVSELLDNTDYIFYLVKDCGNEAYSAVVSAPFHTKMGAAAVPYSDDFENGNNWMFINGNLTNAWAYGEAAHNGEGTHALYISNDGGASNAYTNNSAALVYAVKVFNFEEGIYNFQYDWKANGESTWDFMRVALVPDSIELAAATSLPSGLSATALPAAWNAIALDGGSKLNLVTAWQTQICREVAISAGTYKVVFLWRDDTSGGTQTPAAVDNFSITKITCLAVSELNVTDITSASATIGWTSGSEDQNAWQMVYSCNPQFDLANVTEEEIIDVASNTYALSNLETDTLYTVYVRANCGEDDGVSTWATTTFNTASACQMPDDLASADVTVNSAVISWNTYGQTGFNLRYSMDAQNWTVVENVDMPYTITDLEPGTKYYVQAQVTCGDPAQWSSYILVKTAYAAPFNEPFNASSIPADWSQAQGLMSDILAGGEFTTGSVWNFGTANNVFDSHARINIYGTARKHWLMTPSIFNGGNNQLTFDLALTVYTSGSSAAPTAGSQPDDKFAVLISTDNGATWALLREWNNSGSAYVYDAISNAGEEVTIDLSAYVGQQIIIGFYGESTASGGDNNLHIDNVSIDAIPACVKPSALTVSDVFARSATLAWESNATAWDIAIDTIAGFNPDTLSNIITVNENPYTLTNLLPNHTYYVYVRANCGDEDGNSVWTDKKSFKTTISCPAPNGLEAHLTMGNGSIATLTWIAAEASEWTVQYALDNTFADPIEVVVNEASIDLTGLTAEATYYARVKANCDEETSSDWSAVISFLPTNLYSIVVNDGTKTNDYVPVYGMYVDNGTTASQFIVPAESLQEIMWDSITTLTFYASQATSNWGASEFEVYMTTTEDATLGALVDWNSLTQVMVSGNLSIVDNKMVVSLSEPFHYTGDNLLIGFKQTAASGGSSFYSTSSWYGVTANGASIGGYGSGNNMAQRNFLPKMTIGYVPGQAPACMWATHLAVSDITAEGATFAWDAVEGANWEYALVMAGEEPVAFSAAATNPLVLDNLFEATSYVFYLRNNCGEENSKLVSIAFSTIENIETIPYETQFQDAATWKLVNSDNAWTFNGNDANLFISNDGTNYAYDEDAASVSFATKLFDFAQAGDYTFTYFWKAVGEYNDEDGAIDYLRVALIPAAVELTAGVAPEGLSAQNLPVGWIALDDGEALVANDIFTRHDAVVNVPAGHYRVAFIWINDDSYSDGEPAAINCLYVKSGVATGIEEGNAGFENKAIKFIKDNHVYILINGAVYNVTGQKVEVK